MAADLLSPPLARWDGLHLVLDLATVERHLNRVLGGVDAIRDLELRGAGDALEAEATVLWKGVPARVGLQLAEIRLRHRHLGFRLRRLRALGGVPVPKTALELGLSAMGHPMVTVFRGQGIVVVDLRRWLPEELSLRVVTVQATPHFLHCWFGAGSLADLPGRGPRRLEADTRTG